MDNAYDFAVKQYFAPKNDAEILISEVENALDGSQYNNPGIKGKVIQHLRNTLGPRPVVAFPTKGTGPTIGSIAQTYYRAIEKNAAQDEDGYAAVFDAFSDEIIKDAKSHFGMFLDIYRYNLEQTLHGAREETAVILKEQIQKLSEPARTTLSPSVLEPGSHQAKLLAQYEDHSFENMQKRRGGDRPV